MLATFPDSSATHHAPQCRCGSRRTERKGYLRRLCHECGDEFHYRLSDGVLLPFGKATAEAIDERRAM